MACRLVLVLAWLSTALTLLACASAPEPTPPPLELSAAAKDDFPTPSPEARPTAPPATPTPRPATPTPVPTPGLPVNELGRIVILQYHVVGDEELRWTRRRDNFRRDLETLYKKGYRLLSITDYLDNNIRTPAGFTPVILSFDDSNRSHFQFIKQPDGKLKVDPQCALGILEAFIDEHPDFGRAALFSILPAADPPNDLFGQPEYAQAKLRYLANRGYDLANHTLWHGNLATMDKKGVAEQLGRAIAMVQELLPGHAMDVLTLPFGEYPEDIRWALSGSWEGHKYRHRAILEVAGGPAYAPNHRKMDPLHLPRVQAIQNEWDIHFGRFDKDPSLRYVSDGDPSTVVVPRRLLADLDKDSLGSKRLAVVD